MMAEMKYSEAQKVLEFELTHHSTSQRIDLLPLYLESLKEQGKSVPSEAILEMGETGDLRWLADFDPKDEKKFFLRLMRLRMKAAEVKGELEKLHDLISTVQLFLFEIKAPSFPQELHSLIDKYFKTDFQLKLQNLALNLLLRNSAACEAQVHELILSCFERSTVKGKHERLKAIMDVILPYEDLAFTQLYYHLGLFLSRAPQERLEFKKLTELVIFFEDFKIKVLLLHILDRDGFSDSVKVFVKEIRQNKDYDFVYLDKYFPHLKKHFTTITSSKGEAAQEVKLTAEDLVLGEKVLRTNVLTANESETMDEETLIMQSLKYQEHKSEELIDIAVSFIQSELPRVALRASELAMERSQDEGIFLKACYLKITALLQLKDYRGALDWCHRALEKAQERSEILAFLYGQAEAYLRLNLYGDAKFILKKIMTIDQNYRLTKERLSKLE